VAEKPLNILLLMTDEHRADHLSCLPGGRMETPNLDRIADGHAFSQCITVNPICTPARCSLLTGRYSRQINMLSMSGDLDWRIPTYMQALQRSGYHTGSVGKLHWWQGWPWSTPAGGGHELSASREDIRRYGLDEVWEAAGKQLAVKNDCDYIAHLRAKGLVERYRNFVESCGGNCNDLLTTEQDLNPWPLDEEDYVDVILGERIVESIRNRRADRPFFLFGSFCSPHQPFDPPQRYLDRVGEPDLSEVAADVGEWPHKAREHLKRLIRGYQAMIHLVDEQVGRILATLEEESILDETVILFAADHGDMLGDHSRMQKQTWQGGSVNVPCLIRHPEHLTGRRTDTPVELTDITATMLDVAGLDPTEALGQRWPAFGDRIPGRSLMPIVRGEADRVREFAYSECHDRWQMVRSDTCTYVREVTGPEPGQTREMLFDRSTDPMERQDRLSDPSLAETLAACRTHREWVLDHFPAVQLRWAPSRDRDR
jgi:arylsulfatase A-like enzyme